MTTEIMNKEQAKIEVMRITHQLMRDGMGLNAIIDELLIRGAFDKSKNLDDGYKNIKDARPPLSIRQRQLLVGIASGHGHKEIAKGLGLSFCTVKAHLVHARAKMGARTSAEAAVKAAKAGLL